MNRLQREFFERSSVHVARDLVGCLLVRNLGVLTLTGRIVETEAYGDATDLASHSAVYRRSRGDILASQPGTVYVYLSYGLHYCFNIVAHESGGGGAVLLRAVEPVEGIDEMIRLRGTSSGKRITSGPGRLTQAFGLSAVDHGADVVDGADIMLGERSAGADVLATARIGITRDVDRPWRFIDASSNFVSKPHSSRSRRTLSAC